MRKREFIGAVAAVLKDVGARKPVTLPKSKFYIRDDNNKEVMFTVKPDDKAVLYTVDDVDKILAACFVVVEESLKRGEPISLQDFGSIGVIQRKATRAKDPNGSGEWFDIEAHYVPKVVFGKKIRIAAKLFDLASKDNDTSPEPIPDEDDWGGDE